TLVFRGNSAAIAQRTVYDTLHGTCIHWRSGANARRHRSSESSEIRHHGVLAVEAVDEDDSLFGVVGELEQITVLRRDVARLENGVPQPIHEPAPEALAYEHHGEPRRFARLDEGQR